MCGVVEEAMREGEVLSPNPTKREAREFTQKIVNRLQAGERAQTVRQSACVVSMHTYFLILEVTSIS